MGYPHHSGEDCPNDDCNGEKVRTTDSGNSIYTADKFGCTDCDWSGANMPTG